MNKAVARTESLADTPITLNGDIRTTTHKRKSAYSAGINIEDTHKPDKIARTQQAFRFVCGRLIFAPELDSSPSVDLPSSSNAFANPTLVGQHSVGRPREPATVTDISEDKGVPAKGTTPDPREKASVADIPEDSRVPTGTTSDPKVTATVADIPEDSRVPAKGTSPDPRERSTFTDIPENSRVQRNGSIPDVPLDNTRRDTHESCGNQIHPLLDHDPPNPTTTTPQYDFLTISSDSPSATREEIDDASSSDVEIIETTPRPGIFLERLTSEQDLLVLPLLQVVTH
ncbi:hypothetical protein R1sor_009306 [Riccia sorocarpa]|uniref:Uncharacterized protein n=1 Tax=Riccia sorocarpa TaxID=122646 RepID=A0ABD3HY88_9MARC